MKSMLPIINISELENDFYSVSDSFYSVYTSQVIEYTNTTQTQTASLTRGSLYTSLYSTIQPNVYRKTTQLDNYVFDCKLNITQDELNYHIKNTIKTQLNNDFITKLYDVSSDGRKKTSDNGRFDISLKNFKYNQDKNVVNIYDKFISLCNYIAISGRIGSGTFMMFNKNVYNQLYKYINNNIYSNTIHYEISDLITNDVIIFGRKNELSHPGIHAIIQTDENNNIKFIQSETPYNTRYCYSFKIDTFGSTVENQYLMVDTKNLSDYRYEKLKQINASQNE